jgi:hypothetical protein
MLIWTSASVGKGKIDSEIGEGQYSVTLDYGKSERDSKVSALDAKIAKLTSAGVTLQSTYEAAVLDTASAVAAMGDAIRAYHDKLVAGGDASAQKKTLQGLTDSSNWGQMDLQSKKTAMEQNKADLVAAQKQHDILSGLTVEKSDTLWCVDYTLEATGDIGTIEIPGEPLLTVIVPECKEPTVKDGHVMPRALQEAHQVYLNAAILPGMQKWKPTYRVGVIGDIDTDENTCSVDLDAAQSSAQNLDINQDTKLTGVPIQYMDCDCDAFEDGDRVVVKFDGQDWDSPQVIGFESHPKDCYPMRIWHYIHHISLQEIGTFRVIPRRFSDEISELYDQSFDGHPFDHWFSEGEDFEWPGYVDYTGIDDLEIHWKNQDGSWHQLEFRACDAEVAQSPERPAIPSKVAYQYFSEDTPRQWALCVIFRSQEDDGVFEFPVHFSLESTFGYPADVGSSNIPGVSEWFFRNRSTEEVYGHFAIDHGAPSAAFADIKKVLGFTYSLISGGAVVTEIHPFTLPRLVGYVLSDPPA